MRGVRGGGTVYQKTRIRKDGGTRTFWVAQIYTPIDGTMRRIEGQGPTPTAAVLARGRAVARAEEGLTRTPHPTTQRGTLAALMTDWNDTRVVKPRTREHTASVIKNHIAPEKIGQKTLRAVRGADVQRLLLTRETDWTRVAVFKALRSFFTYALQGGMLKTDPLKTIPRPKMPKARLANSVSMGRVVTRLKGVLGWMRRTELDKARPRMWARIMVALEGLRPGEARGLRWSDLYHLNGRGGTPSADISVQLGYAGGVLALTPVKGGSPRTVVLRRQTAQALRRWKKKRDGLRKRKSWHPREGFEDLVFCLDDGKPMRQQEDDAAWNALLVEAQKNIKHPELITFWPMAYNRHVAVTLMRDAGVPASLVAAMMGHSIVVEDQHYYNSQLAAQTKAAAMMDGWLDRHTTSSKKTKTVPDAANEGDGEGASAGAEAPSQDGSQSAESDSEG